jgi:bifunctional UDP-N-acetylglucosamine pyrophosphorylase/glucosamine-1-phosphate N-acetyltransferase
MFLLALARASRYCVHYVFSRYRYSHKYHTGQSFMNTLQPQPAFSAVILAAGKGTRMKSELPKVMHCIANRPMVAHVVHTVSQLSPQHIVLVTAAHMEQVVRTAQAADARCTNAIQQQQLGTGDAVKAAQPALQDFNGTVLVLYGDTPLIRPETLQRMLEASQHTDVVVLGMRPRDAGAYGRLLLNESGELLEIIEFKDADEDIRAITLCNSGVMAVSGKANIFALLSQVTNMNANQEYYLTDIVAIARGKGLRCGVVEAPEEELMGVNSRRELAQAEAIFQRHMRLRAMDEGATLIDPNSVFFSADTQLGRDVVIQPNVYFGEGVRIGNDVEIRMGCHIEGATIGDECIVGPFARLRTGTVLAGNNKIGNFVELKKTTMDTGAQASHLSYLGDAHIGSNSNIGAGAITCNYDGFDKFETHIGAGAFIGSNTALVAPVRVGDGAIIGAGSVITEDVGADDLAFTRPARTEKKGWAALFRQKKKKS